MSTQTQKTLQTSPQETAKEKPGHHGGSDGHICWRCALKKALALGAATSISSFMKDMAKVPIVERALRVAQVSEKEMGEIADALHDVVIFLDSFSGRSDEVN